MLLLMFLGPEKLGRNFSVMYNNDIAEVIDKDIKAVLRERDYIELRERDSSDNRVEKKRVKTGAVGKEFI